MDVKTSLKEYRRGAYFKGRRDEFTFNANGARCPGYLLGDGSNCACTRPKGPE